MTGISIQEMLDAGAHFGHQTKKWNPKMQPYIYGARSGVHILDLQQTQTLAEKAFNVVEEIVARGENVLFVGTKKQAQSVVEAQAKRCSMPFITRRWLGGMLTNFAVIRKSIENFIEMETRREKNDFSGFTKRELLGIDRELAKKQLSLGGIKILKRPPGALFVVDPGTEKIAVHEANVLGIPVIAVTDSNCNPDPVDYVIPANDDALRSLQIFTAKIADACLAGLQKRDLRAREEEVQASPKKKGRKAQEMGEAGKAYVSKADQFEGAVAEEGFKAVVEEEKPSEPFAETEKE